MLTIRLTRTGKKSQQSFRIVVAEKSKAVKRQYVELLGHYIPSANPKVLSFNKERVLYWIGQGAKPSESVASLLKKEGMPNMDQYIFFTQDKKFKKKKGGDEEAVEAPKEVKEVKEDKAEEAPVEAPAEEVQVEAKAEEAPVEAPVEEAVEEKTEEAPAEEAKVEEKPVETPVEEKTEEAPAEEKKEGE